MKKVKVIDLDGFLNEQMGEQLAARGLKVRAGDVVILSGGEKCIVSDNEAIHEIFELKDDSKYKVDLFEQDKVLENGSTAIGIVPVASVGMPIGVLLELVSPELVKERSLTEFVQRFGSRIESNYRLLLKSIKEIGLDPKDYPREA